MGFSSTSLGTRRWFLPCFAVLYKIAVEETLELAAKKSGKILAPAAKKTAEKALREAVLKYGDDALKAVKNGGLEALEQAA